MPGSPTEPTEAAVADFHGDQAAGLRRLFGREKLQVVTFAAGCNGVGRTLVVANVALSLAKLGKEVLVLDENTGHDNVAAWFGAPASHDLLQVVNQERRLADVLVEVAPGVHVLPAAQAVKKLGKLTLRQQQALLDGLGELERPADVILVDAAIDHPLGFSPLSLAAQETVVMLSGVGSAITEAYALIKKMSLGFARRNFRILVSKVRGAQDAQSIFDNMAQVAGQRLHARLDYAGYIPLDEAIKRADALGQPVGTAFPEASSARAFRLLAGELSQWPAGDQEGAGLEQFVQQLLHLSQRISPSVMHLG